MTTTEQQLPEGVIRATMEEDVSTTPPASVTTGSTHINFNARMKNRSSLDALQTLAADRLKTYSADIEEESTGSCEEDVLSLGKATSFLSASAQDAVLLGLLSCSDSSIFRLHRYPQNNFKRHDMMRTRKLLESQNSSSDRMNLNVSQSKTRARPNPKCFQSGISGRPKSQRSSSDMMILSRNSSNDSASERKLTRSMSAFSMSSREMTRDYCPSKPIRALSPEKKGKPLSSTSKRAGRFLNAADRNLSPTKKRREKHHFVIRGMAAPQGPVNGETYSNSADQSGLARKAMHHSPIKKKVSHKSVKRSRKATDYRRLQPDREEHAYQFFQGLYELRSDEDSDESESTGSHEEEPVHANEEEDMTDSIEYTCSSTVANSLDQSLTDSAIRWSSSQGNEKNASSCSLQLPTRYVSPKKVALDKCIDFDSMLPSEGRQKDVLSLFIGLVESLPEHNRSSAFAA